jgi:hypothetical protein
MDYEVISNKVEGCARIRREFLFNTNKPDTSSSIVRREGMVSDVRWLQSFLKFIVDFIFVGSG